MMDLNTHINKSGSELFRTGNSGTNKLKKTAGLSLLCITLKNDKIGYRIFKSLFFILVILVPTGLFSFQDPDSGVTKLKTGTEKIKKVGIDSSTTNQMPDSLKKELHSKKPEEDTTKAEPVDTVKPFVPLYTHGSMFMIPFNNYRTVGKKDIQYDNYSGLFDILKYRIPSFPLSLGSFGQFNHLSVFGGSPRDINIRFNGHQFNDFGWGSYNLEQYPAEFMEKAEILTGSDAVVFSDNASSALINLQEIRYNTAKPYTRIVMSQAAYEYLLSDGIFSQNIKKNWNFTFGFRRMSTDGRFDNQWFNSWNVRGILRWNLSEKTNISLVESFTNHGMGTNGGIDLYYSDNIFDNLAAYAVFEYVNERVYRHDLTLTASSYLADDSSSALSGSAYFTHEEWNRARPGQYIFSQEDTRDITKWYSRQVGALMKYEQNILKVFTLRIGGEVNRINLERSDYNYGFNDWLSAAFSHLTFNIFRWMDVSGGLRASLTGERKSASAGIKLNFKASDYLEVFADISRSERTPSPSESLSLNNEKNLFALLEARLIIDKTFSNLNIFWRNTNSPIITIPYYDSLGKNIVGTYSMNGISRQVIGSSFSAGTLLFGHIGLETNINSWLLDKTDGKDYQKYPDFYGLIKGWYELLIGSSLMRLGVSFCGMTLFNGESYIPWTRSYVMNPIKSVSYYNNLDVFLNARLGSAYIRVTWANILNRGYYYVPFNPGLDRHFMITVSWSFFE